MRNTDIAAENITATVVVFIPPAVEPGELPVSMRTIVIIIPVLLIIARLAVLKPAVLGIKDWKGELNILYLRGVSENSKKKTEGRHNNYYCGYGKNNLALHMIFVESQFVF